MLPYFIPLSIDLLIYAYILINRYITLHGDIMHEIKSYKELMAAQVQIREELLKYLMANPMAWEKAAKEIGISQITIKKFAIDEADMDFIILSKIRNYNLKNSNKH